MTNLKLGTCMLCGEPCNQHRYTHDKCATAYFEAKRAAMKKEKEVQHAVTDQ